MLKKIKDKLSNKSKLYVFLSVFLFIQLLVCCYFSINMFIQIYEYNFLGNFEFHGITYAKCDRAVNCSCSSIYEKCKCIYYDDDRKVEQKIKCVN